MTMWILKLIGQFLCLLNAVQFWEYLTRKIPVLYNCTRTRLIFISTEHIFNSFYHVHVFCSSFVWGMVLKFFYILQQFQFVLYFLSWRYFGTFGFGNLSYELKELPNGTTHMFELKECLQELLLVGKIVPKATSYQWVADKR